MSNESCTKSYVACRISEDASIFKGYYGDYVVNEDLLKKLSKSLGFSWETYLTLNAVDSEAADRLVKSMSKKKSYDEIFLLVDTKNSVVLDYSLEQGRTPLLNTEFNKRVRSLVEACDSLEIVESHHIAEDTISTLLIKKIDPISVEEKFISGENKIINYHIGILMVNDELTGTSCRLVIYADKYQPLYLPASWYSTSTSRYKRSSSNSSEALELLVLRVIDDLRENALYDKVYEIHHRYRKNKEILSSYEEYNSVLKTMRRIPTIIEDNSFLENLLAKYENFERKYSHVEDQQSSYIWRCTAISDITVGALISITSRILYDLSAPPMEYFNIRDLLGTYMSTYRIVEEIAKEVE